MSTERERVTVKAIIRLGSLYGEPGFYERFLEEAMKSRGLVRASFDIFPPYPSEIDSLIREYEEYRINVLNQVSDEELADSLVNSPRIFLGLRKVLQHTTDGFKLISHPYILKLWKDLLEEKVGQGTLEWGVLQDYFAFLGNL